MRDSGSFEPRAVGDVHGDFFVPAYQRGYRWTATEVRQLLDDIKDSNGTTYYLQPVVVKERADESWELVDGQQRLTTLYLVFRYLQRTHLPTARAGYSITYETRPDSKRYLDELTEADATTNIDFFHMYGAYKCIEAWFDQAGNRATREATRLHDALFDNVKVLWYEAPDDVDSTDLFTRLNVGRIPLTDAELVKAQLLCRTQAQPGQADRSLEIAANWDLIERELRNPELWAFVTGDAGAEATHISLLLDTLAGGERGRDRAPFRTFETLRPLIDEDAHAFWRRVVDLHSLVLGWFDDRSLYHKVGYLVAVGHSFAELVELANGRGRSAFEQALDDEISAHLALTADDVSNLTYTSRKTSDVLLLMNVETIRRTQDSSERYSFHAHAAGGWSLEHIHAQGAEPLTTADQWRSWLSYQRAALVNLPGVAEDYRRDLLERVDEVLDGEVTKQSFVPLESEITAVFTPQGEPTDDVDSIANLALLDQRDNSALNNSVFEVKRREVIDRDKSGSYIPACTRNIFLKYYTGSVNQQMHFWSKTDREEYLNALNDVIAPYLRAEEALTDVG